ncbi:MAG: DinB family protein [Vicinamibacterales bacterium]
MSGGEMELDALRRQLSKALDWEDAHAGFDRAVEGVPHEKQGIVPPGFAWSLWQLVEHLRLTQFDILDFCRNPQYVEAGSMAAYWPPSAAPPSEGSWDEAIAGIRRDRDALKAMARDAGVDLFARIPHGDGQTYLRELILVVDHSAYHIGQIVAVRRALGIWSPGTP